MSIWRQLWTACALSAFLTIVWGIIAQDRFLWIVMFPITLFGTLPHDERGRIEMPQRATLSSLVIAVANLYLLHKFPRPH